MRTYQWQKFGTNNVTVVIRDMDAYGAFLEEKSHMAQALAFMWIDNRIIYDVSLSSLMTNIFCYAMRALSTEHIVCQRTTQPFNIINWMIISRRIHNNKTRSLAIHSLHSLRSCVKQNGMATAAASSSLCQTQEQERAEEKKSFL